MNISTEQAAQIHDLQSYCEVTGAKRFKRTKEEVSLGLSPEDALRRRLASIAGVPQDAIGPAAEGSNFTGSLTIRLRPAAGTDADYFKHLSTDPIELEMEENWYSWFDNRLEVPYNGDMGKLLKDILNRGIGEIIKHVHFESDL